MYDAQSLQLTQNVSYYPVHVKITLKQFSTTKFTETHNYRPYI